MLWVESVVALSSFRTNCVGEPCVLKADMETATVPITVEPLAGLVIEADSAGVPPTVIVTVGGLGLLAPRLSSTVSEAVYTPGFAKVTAPGFCALLFEGEPPGKSHVYCAIEPSGSLAVPAKVTDCPTAMLTLPLGLVMVAVGRWFVGSGRSWRNFAADGTPFPSRRKTM